MAKRLKVQIPREPNNVGFFVDWSMVFGGRAVLLQVWQGTLRNSNYPGP